MEQIQCVHCGTFFDVSPRHRNQTACRKKECQRARKKAWHRFKLKTDPDYRAGKKISQQKWLIANPGYWKQYRKKNPEYAERNRILQAIRNRKHRAPKTLSNTEPPLIAKMDASKSYSFEILGQFWLIPVIAKIDALKVNIARIPIYYP